jgi:hypothetical protein
MEKKKKKIRDDCMIIVVVRTVKEKGQRGAKENTERERKRWGETDAKLTSSDISYQRKI